MEKKFLSEREVAAIYGISVPWLKKSRGEGTGPVFSKIGRSVRYSAAAVEIFLQSKQAKSTSDYTARNFVPEERARTARA
jgi:predicted DNA-binding transcriptional regulator AlpA